MPSFEQVTPPSAYDEAVKHHEKLLAAVAAAEAKDTAAEDAALLALAGYIEEVVPRLRRMLPDLDRLWHEEHAKLEPKAELRGPSEPGRAADPEAFNEESDRINTARRGERRDARSQLEALDADITAVRRLTRITEPDSIPASGLGDLIATPVFEARQLRADLAAAA